MALRREKLPVGERSLSTLSEILHFAHLEFEGGSEAVGEALGCHELAEIVELVDERRDLCDLDAASIGPCRDVDTLFEELMWERRHKEARRLQEFLDTIGPGFSEAHVSNALGIFDTTALIDLVEVRSDLVDLDAALQRTRVDALFEGVFRARCAPSVVQNQLEPNSTTLPAESTEVKVREAAQPPSLVRAPWASVGTEIPTQRSLGGATTHFTKTEMDSSQVPPVTNGDGPHDRREGGKGGGKHKGRGDGRSGDRKGQGRGTANFGIQSAVIDERVCMMFMYGYCPLSNGDSCARGKHIQAHEVVSIDSSFPECRPVPVSRAKLGLLQSGAMRSGRVAPRT